jgi:threonine/homoserine/homoserine lactone efflux protein
MLDLTTFLTYFSAALLLAIVPGSGMLYVLARSLHGGRKEGVHSSLGTAVGGSVHVLAAAFGLSAILAASSLSRVYGCEICRGSLSALSWRKDVIGEARA